MQKRKQSSKTFLTTILFAVCFFTLTVFVYKTVIDKIVDNKQNTIESFKEEQFDVIWTSLKTLQMQAENEVTEVSQNIEKDILNLPSEELLKLQKDMTNNTLNQNLHEILNENIKKSGLNGIKNHMNGIVVMTIDGYIEDFNYYRTNKENDSNVRTWELVVDNSYNKELEKDAIDKLLNRGSGVIALESFNLTKDDNHILINELTYESLLEVFLKEGMNGLRNYQIFVPYYITDFGDIFGTPDIIHGSKVDNNKLIVVQEFNLHDQIINNHGELFNDQQTKDLINRYEELLRLLYILGLTFITSMLGFIIYLCTIYNDMINVDAEDDEEKDDLLLDDKESQTNE